MATVRKPPKMEKWEALLRGQVISTTTQKFFGYVQLADQKAQALILLNSILIPITINWIVKDTYALPSAISLITAILSILTAIICIYPRRRSGRKPNRNTQPPSFWRYGTYERRRFSKRISTHL